MKARRMAGFFSWIMIESQTIQSEDSAMQIPISDFDAVLLTVRVRVITQNDRTTASGIDDAPPRKTPAPHVLHPWKLDIYASLVVSDYIVSGEGWDGQHVGQHRAYATSRGATREVN